MGLPLSFLCYESSMCSKRRNFPIFGALKGGVSNSSVVNGKYKLEKKMPM